MRILDQVDERSDPDYGGDYPWHYIIYEGDGANYYVVWDSIHTDVTVSRVSSSIRSVSDTNTFDAEGTDEELLLPWAERYLTAAQWDALWPQPEAFILELVL